MDIEANTMLDPSSYIVEFDQGDREDPKNFNSYYKAFLTFQLSLLAFAGSLGSSIIAPAETLIANDVGISLEVAVLTVSLYVLGMHIQATTSAAQMKT